MELPSWEKYWDLYLSAGGVVLILLQLAHHKLTDRIPKRLTKEEQEVDGLPFYTEPSYWRLLFAMPIFIFGTILVAAIFQSAPYWQHLIAYLPVFGFALLILAGLGIKEKQAAWERDDKLERQKKVAEAQELQLAAAQQQHIAEENSHYAPITPTTTPVDITETARRVAQDLKRG